MRRSARFVPRDWSTMSWSSTPTRDGSAEIALSSGADVAQEDDVLSEYGPSLGKGDAMWRGVSLTQADISVSSTATPSTRIPTTFRA